MFVSNVSRKAKTASKMYMLLSTAFKRFWSLEVWFKHLMHKAGPTFVCVCVGVGAIILFTIIHYTLQDQEYCTRHTICEDLHACQNSIEIYTLKKGDASFTHSLTSMINVFILSSMIHWCFETHYSQGYTRSGTSFWHNTATLSSFDGSFQVSMQAS